MKYLIFIYFFQLNIGFLIFSLILYVFPFYIWVVTERERKEIYPNII